MIRSRIGAAGIGAGGSATDYSFDSTGLSNDPRLAPYLQSLTPAQLQHALDDNADASTQDLRDLLNADVTGTGPGWLPCGGANDPTCSGAGSGFNLPMAAWIAGGALLALLLIPKR